MTIQAIAPVKPGKFGLEDPLIDLYMNLAPDTGHFHIPDVKELGLWMRYLAEIFDVFEDPASPFSGEWWQPHTENLSHAWSVEVTWQGIKAHLSLCQGRESRTLDSMIFVLEGPLASDLNDQVCWLCSRYGQPVKERNEGATKKQFHTWVIMGNPPY
jgi:hypothetical protein